METPPEETMSSDRLPLVIRIFVVALVIRRTKRAPGVCSCGDGCRRRKRRVGRVGGRGRGERESEKGINRSIYSTFKRTDGRKKKRQRRRRSAKSDGKR